MDSLESKTNQLICNGITWLHLDNPSKKDFSRLEAHYNLHPVHLKESVQTIQQTQVEREDNYIFLLVHVPTHDPATDRIHTSQVGVFLGKDYVITISDGRKSVISDFFSECQTNQETAEKYCHESAGYLLYGILKNLLEDVSGTIETLLAELDTIEGLVFDDNKSDAFEIGKVRQKITRIKRVVKPLQLVLGDLAQQIKDFGGEGLIRYYSNNAKLAHKLTEVIDEAQETIEIFKDADFTTSTEQTNQILAVLTLVFTFTIPVTVLGTLYGMNVPLPGGTDFAMWTGLGAYTTAILIAITSFIMALVMYLYFKTKRWF